MKAVHKYTQKKSNAGFTLVELIIVISIMSVLMGILAPRFLKYIDKAKASASAYDQHTLELNSKEIKEVPFTIVKSGSAGYAG